MRFFDEDNNRFQKTMIVFVIGIFFYCASYYVLRENGKFRTERDGCSLEGCEMIGLPMAAYYFYNPLIHADRYMTPQIEFNFN